MPQPPVILLAFANDRESDSQYLRNLPKEQKYIREALATAQKAGLCEVIERSNATLAELLDVLQSETYRDRLAIFHYGGHASSYQLLLETLEGEVAIAHAEGFNGLLGRRNSLKLVFLNGCCTELQSKALNDAGVPLVIGTQKVIQDEVATKLAARFYAGIGRGLNIDQAWRDAEDEIRTQAKKGNNYRGFRIKDALEESWPWTIHQKEGAAQILNWNLPEAAGDPLFGLPPLADDISFPQPPYLYLQRYERAHAKLFSGRSTYIRQLYNLVTDQNGPFLIHLYGASGVGKSSLLDAGLLPRLESQAQVVYIRRDGNISASKLILNALNRLFDQSRQTDTETVTSLDNIQQTLSQLHQTKLTDESIDITQLRQQLTQLTQQLDTYQFQSQKSNRQPTDEESILHIWQQIEASKAKPLVIILDQLESVFLQDGHQKQIKEWEALIDLLKQIAFPGTKLKGKLIFSYRKEYHPEVEGMIKQAQLPFQTVFLNKLNEEAVIEIVHHLEQVAFESIYHLEVEEGLGQLIANEVLKHESQSVAPILQILLTKMWEEAEDSADRKRYFSEDLYRNLSRKGLILQNFFQEQLQILKDIDPEKVKSGLVLDILHTHTTSLGTATSQGREELKHRYQHIPHTATFLDQCVNQTFLLRQSGDRFYLMHDTLAPIVRRAYHQSDAAGQKAVRILESRVRNHEDETGNFLSELDLQQVQEGKTGMRKWTEQEQVLVAKSTEALEKQKRKQKQIRYALTTLLVLFVAASTLGTLAYFNYRLTYGDLQRVEGQLDTINIDLANKKDSIQQINSSLVQKETEIQNLEQLGKSLTLSNRQIQAQSAENRRKFQSNQLSAQSSRISDGYQAFQLAKKAYNLSPNNPFALGAMMRAYQMQPFSKIDTDAKTSALQELCEVVIENGQLRAFNTNGQETFTMPYSDDTFEEKVSVSSDGKYMAALFNFFEVRVWNRTGRMITLPEGEDALLETPQFLTQRPNILLASDSILWNINADMFQPPIYEGKTSKFTSIPNTSKWVIGQDRYIQVWDNTYQKTLVSWELGRELKDLAISPDGQHIATAAGTSLQLWSLKGELLGTFDNNQRDVNQISFSSDGKHLLSAESEHLTSIWEIASLKQIKRLRDGGDSWRVISASFSPNDRFVATVSNDRYLRIWDWKRNSLAPVVEKELNTVGTAVAFSTTGNQLVTTDNDGNIYIWRWNGYNLKLLAQVPFTESIDAFTVNPKSDDLEIFIWGNTRGSLLRYIPEDNYLYELFSSDFAEDAMFSDDGKSLYRATSEGTLPPLLLDPKKMIEYIEF